MRIVDLDITRGDECSGEWRNIITPDDNPLYPPIPVCRSLYIYLVMLVVILLIILLMVLNILKFAVK